jgi:hypothetical protein
MSDYLSPRNNTSSKQCQFITEHGYDDICTLGMESSCEIAHYVEEMPFQSCELPFGSYKISILQAKFDNLRISKTGKAGGIQI